MDSMINRDVVKQCTHLGKIGTNLCQLSIAIDHLYGIINDTIAIIQPIILPPRPTKEECPKEIASEASDIAKTLQAQIDRIDFIATSLELTKNLIDL